LAIDFHAGTDRKRRRAKQGKHAFSRYTRHFVKDFDVYHKVPRGKETNNAVREQMLLLPPPLCF
jgi:hypothetical protein